VAAYLYFKLARFLRRPVLRVVSLTSRLLTMLQQYQTEKPTSRTHFKSSEGKYTLHTERSTGTVLFQAQRCTRISVATLQGGQEQGSWVVYNVQENLMFSRPNELDQVTPAAVAEKMATSTFVSWNVASRNLLRPCALALQPH
jgi:hypothetical protein